MEQNKYIPGDWVMTNGIPLGTAKDVVYRVTSSDPSMSLELNDGTVLKGAVRLENIEGAKFGEKGYLLAECCAWVKDIVPIPLTPEILEESGWKKWTYSSSKGQYTILAKDFDDNVSRTTVMFFKQVIKAEVWHRGYHLGIYLSYVHQLQHLLFGLGLDFDFNLEDNYENNQI